MEERVRATGAGPAAPWRSVLFPAHLGGTEADLVARAYAGAAQRGDYAEAGEAAEELGFGLVLGEVQHLRHHREPPPLYLVAAFAQLVHGEAALRLRTQHRQLLAALRRRRRGRPAGLLRPAGAAGTA